jgi:hypothetical protein
MEPSFINKNVSFGQEHCQVLHAKTMYKNEFCNHRLHLLELVLFYMAMDVSF